MTQVTKEPEEKWLNPEQADKRKNCLGAEETHKIKKRSSNLYRYLLQNVYRKKGVKEWDLKLLILPSLLPDLLIIESLAHPIKKKFHLKRVKEEDIALERFIDV
ncbi:uncharacterized protein K441DRAFT_663894 [Cenococcum geophilum 1.58]|uniref:uncharacterized protein n=1 Tax=Cenococcum geophilum 1.58 TaxID=794803 RepID=UPI00358F04C1|nr:hypothetical protein K441DRAFT_663894 [Cenococcum geophilum 1.58]